MNCKKRLYQVDTGSFLEINLVTKEALSRKTGALNSGWALWPGKKLGVCVCPREPGTSQAGWGLGSLPGV